MKPSEMRAEIERLQRLGKPRSTGSRTAVTSGETSRSSAGGCCTAKTKRSHWNNWADPPCPRPSPSAADLPPPPRLSPARS